MREKKKTKFKLLHLDEAEAWDALVTSFTPYDVDYLSGYVRGFQLHGDGEAELIYAEWPQGRMLNVLFKRDISQMAVFQGHLPKNTYFDAKTPYGYGGPLVDGALTLEALDAYRMFCRKQGLICEVALFHPQLRNWELVPGLYQIGQARQTVAMDTSNKEIIWQNLTSKNRNMIRKAQKNGLRTYWGRSPELIPKFMAIYQETMDRDSAKDYYYFDAAYYQSVLDDLPHHALWFYTEQEDVIASMGIFLFADGRMHYHLSASTMAGRRLAATNLMLYDAAVWASQNHLVSLHLGGGRTSAADDSLLKFKHGFQRHDSLEFCVGTAIYDQEKYDFLTQEYERLTGKQANKDFVPCYRG